MRRKLLPVIKYSWDSLPEVDINVYHGKCHLSEANMHRMAIKEGVKLVGKLHKCTDCLMGKAKRASIPKISKYKRSRRLFGRVFLDMSGPFKTRAIGGKRYMATLVDDHSRKKFTYLLHKKDRKNVLKVLKRFVNEEVLPRGLKIEILRTDNDGAFFNDEVIDYLCDNDVIREYTSDYTPEQNAVVETAIRDIKNLAVTLLNASNLHSKHKKLFGEALRTATILMNDFPQAGNAYQSPNAVLGEKGVPLALRYQFGSHALVLKHNSPSNELKMHECIFVGYTSNKPDSCLRFYKLSTGEIIESQNYYVIDGMMLFNKNPFRFDDTFDLDGADVNPTAEDANTEADDLDDSSVGDADDGVDMEIIDRFGTFPSEGETSDDDINNDNDEFDSTSEYTEASSRVDNENDGASSDDATDNDSHVGDDLGGDNMSDAGSSNPSDNEDGFKDNPSPPVSDDDSGSEEEPVRRSHRSDRGVNKKYADYVMHANKLFAKVFFCPDGTIRVPKTHVQAMRSPQAKEWIAAIKKEYESLLSNKTWEVVDRPEGVPLVGCRWVFDLKFDTDGSIKRYKARLVAQGYSQTLGVDYFETFAPVANSVSMRTLLALAAINNWNVRQLDIETAYLNAPVDEDIYMRQVPGFELPGNKVLKLKRSLYGLKQAGRNWNTTLTEFLISIGMTKSSIDPCLFYFHDTDGKIALLSVYVDDIIITGDATEVIDQIIEKLKRRFKVKDLGEAHQLLGMVIERNRDEGTMKIHQGPYIRRMIQQFDIADVRSCKTPTPEDMYSQYIQAMFAKDKRTVEFDYRGAIGCIMHLANTTRPDIANAVRFLSTFVSSYTDIHVKFVKRVLKYLSLTADLGLCYGGSSAEISGAVGSLRLQDIQDTLVAYSDASWADNYSDATSNSGLCVLLGRCLVLWKSVKQRVIANSTMESEYIAMSHCVEELGYVRRLFAELFAVNKTKRVNMETHNKDAMDTVMEATQIYGDNMAAITVGNSSAETKRSRNVNVKFHNVKEAIRNKVIRLSYVPTKKNKADFFTKCLGIRTFEYLRDIFMC